MMKPADQCDRCGRYLFGERDAHRVQEVERLRTALARIADTPYWQGVIMQEIAKEALGQGEKG